MTTSAATPTPPVPPATTPPADGPLARLLAAVLAAADQRRTSALVTAMQGPVAVVSLPDERAGVVLLERGELDAAGLQDRLGRLLSGHEAGLLLVVIVGGDPGADRPVLQAADRKAPDPNKLGLYQLTSAGDLVHVTGRRLGLLPEAARLLPGAVPLTAQAIAERGESTRQQHDQAYVFSQALERRPMYATWVLGAACVACYLLVDHWSRSTPDWLVKLNAGANSASRVRAGEWWRLLSHAFLHGDFAHIAFNMVALYSFGGFLERLLGWRRYLLLYGLSALAGGVASALVGGVDLSVGASGAIWGLMAAGVGLVTARQRLLPALMQNRLRPRFLWLAALNVGLSLLPLVIPAFRIDYWAHLGGGLVGFALVASGWLTRGLPAPAAFSEGERPPPIVDPLVIRVAALLMAAALALSLALAFTKGTPWKIQSLPAAPDGPDRGQETEL